MSNPIIFVLKTKPEHMAGLYNLPGGKIEENESEIYAAIREFKEETIKKIIRA